MNRLSQSREIAARWLALSHRAEAAVTADAAALIAAHLRGELPRDTLSCLATMSRQQHLGWRDQ